MSSFTPRKRFSLEARAHYIELWKNSNLTQSAFCDQHQIPEQRFNSWINTDKSRPIKMLPVVAEQSSFTQESLSVHIKLPSGIYCEFSGYSTFESLIQFIKDYEQCNSLSNNHQSG